MINNKSKLCLSSSHTSKYGCRICAMEGVSHQKDSEDQSTIKKGMFFLPPQNLSEMPPLRTIEEYKLANNRVGLKNPSPFTILKSFHGPMFYSIDELHLFGHNIARQIWQVIENNNYKYRRKNILFLQKQFRVELGSHMAKLQISESKMLTVTLDNFMTFSI